MSPERKASKPAIVSLAVLFLLRVAICWYGYDRLPGITGHDEAFISDPALALSRGLGFAARSLEGLAIGEHYAHYPPLFILVQAATFRLFGLSPFTLRFWPIVFHLLSCAMMLLLLHAFWRRGWIDGWAAVVCGALPMMDLALLWIARGGRMDSLAALLGLAALCVLYVPRSDVFSRGCAISAGILVGLSLTAHPSAIFFWWALVVLLFLQRQALGWTVLAISCALPAIVLVAVWCSVHGSYSWAAFQQFRMYNSVRNDQGFLFARWARSIRNRSMETLHIGGVMSLVIMVAWPIQFCRSLFDQRQGTAMERQRHARPDGAGDAQYQTGLWAFIGLGLLLLVIFVAGMRTQRVVVLCPLILVGLALALSGLGPRLRRVAIAGAIVVMLVNAASLVACVYETHRVFDIRNPETRFAGLPVRLDPAKPARIVGEFDLWYYFAKVGQPYRMTNIDIYDDRNYWRDKPSRFDDYAIVILASDDPLLKLVDMRNRRITTFRDYARQYVIAEKVEAKP